VTPASARGVRRARVRSLAQSEPDLSHREMGLRLGISKDTVRRDLEALAQDEPQVTGGGAPGGAECDTGVAATGAPGAHGAPRMALPQRMAQDGGAVDLSQMPGLRRDLALLAQTGKSVEALIHQAVVAMAFGYRTALARGHVEPEAPFIVRDMTLVTAVRPAAAVEPAPDRA
jgi:hypothetical protein